MNTQLKSEVAEVKPGTIETHRHKRGVNANPAVLTHGLDDLTEISDSRFGLDVERATQVWTVLSHVLGEATGWRSFTTNLCQGLGGIAHLEIIDKDPLTGAEMHFPAPMPEIPVAGWPNTESAMRRLGWSPSRLNAEWNKAVAVSGGFARLPLPLVVHIFPPEIWRMVAQVIDWTPRMMNRYLDSYLRVLVAGNAPGEFKRTPRSAGNLQDAVRRLLAQLVKLREDGYFIEALSNWTHVPSKATIKTASIVVDGRSVNEAPELSSTRRYLAELDRRIAQKRRTTQGRRHLLVLLRDRALLETVIVAASRCEPFAAMIVSDIIREYVCPWDRVKRPAVRLRELKGKREVVHYIVITERHYNEIHEYMTYAGIANEPDHQMWHGQWAYFDKVTGEQLQASVGSPLFATIAGREKVMRVLPNCEMTAGSMGSILATLASRCGEPNVHHTAHSLRHLGSQVCKDGAKAYLAEHPEMPGSVTIDVIAKSLMGHEFEKVSDFYDELNTPESKYRYAALGASCVWELLRGDAGARKGLDEPRLLAAVETLQETESELYASEKRTADAEAVLRTVEDGATTTQREIQKLREDRVTMRTTLLELLDSESATDADYRRIQLRQQHLDDEIEHRQDDLVLFERRHNRTLRDEHGRQLALERRLELLRAELETAKAARVPLPDLAAPYDLDARLAELLDGISPAQGGVAPAEPVLLRDKLTVAQYAEVMGIPISTLNRNIEKALKKSQDGFAFKGGRENPRQPFGQPIEQVLEVHSAHARSIVYSALDKSWYHPDQIAAMKAMLAKSM